MMRCLLYVAHNVHSAADVHAHKVWNNVFADRHSSADGAALARVNVRHDAYLRARRKRLIAKCTNLPLRGGLEFVGVDYCCGVCRGWLSLVFLLILILIKHMSINPKRSINASADI